MKTATIKRYRVEISRPAEARGELARIWRENLPLEADALDRYRWTYEEAPLRPESVFLLSLDTSRFRGAIGTAGLLAREFLVDGRPARAGLLSDLAVDCRHRSALPAIHLVREARRYAREHFQFAYGFPAGREMAVFKRCGYRPFGEISRYVRVLEHRDFVYRALRNELAARAGGLLADVAVAARRLPRVAAALAGYRLEWVADVDERFDDLWRRAAAHYRVIACRNAAFVRWRLMSQPGRECRIAGLVSRRNGALRAYAAVELRDRLARLRDFFGHPQDLAPLFELVARAARRSGAESISARFFGDPRPVASLVAAGFRPRPPYRFAILEPDASGCLIDPRAWFTTDADRAS